MHFRTETAFRRAAAAAGFAAAGLVALTSCSSGPTIQKSTTTAYREGVPGGTLVESYKVSVSVAALDRAARKVTLVAPDGSSNTFTAGPDDARFDQLRVGERTQATVTRQLVVLLDSDKSAMQEGPILPPLVTPEEARSGVMRSETMQRVASVIAVDRKRRQATLKLEDGASKTFPIRKDVEPRRIKKGEEVLIQTSSQVVLASAQP